MTMISLWQPTFISWYNIYKYGPIYKIGVQSYQVKTATRNHKQLTLITKYAGTNAK